MIVCMYLYIYIRVRGRSVATKTTRHSHGVTLFQSIVQSEDFARMLGEPMMIYSMVVCLKIDGTYHPNGKKIWKDTGVSENSVPLNPMVNDHYPY